ncbi:type IV secretory system conjugative DNA transfer family protein [Roseovarius sp.]|uniref:type IV secretory system conjugative DNA transfer family protein n=1 Tax=Roseovarius sp. TaxID=1486281 RepID=UPI003A97CA60
MPVRIKPEVGPVNRLLMLAAGAAGITMLTAPTTITGWAAINVPTVSAFCALVMTFTAARRLHKDYQLRENIRISQQVSKEHGSAREATRSERTAAGMDEPSDLLGLDAKDEPVWRPRKLPFSLVEMPPGVGKTVCYVMPWIISRAVAGDSVVITDPKRDLYPMLAPGLRKLGFEVWACSPAGGALGVDDEVELNAFQGSVDAVHAEGDERKNAVRITTDYAEILYPLGSDEKNPYFAYGSRRVIVVAILSEALLNPAGCTPSNIYQLITDPAAFLKRLTLLAKQLETIDKDDTIVAFLKTEARNLLDRYRKNEENFGAFVEGASQRLLSFNPSGHLGGYGSAANHRVGEMRERQVILFIMSPLTHTREFSSFVSLLNHNIIASCKANPGGHKLHVIAEEALNYKWSELTSDMETLRQLNVSADIFIQSFDGLETRYGRDIAKAIESYSDVRIYGGINSLARAKHISESLSDMTVRKQDFSYQARATEVGVTSNEIGRPLMKPNEILAMKPGHAWVFVRGMYPMQLRMVHYGQVDWWRDYVEASPISGTKLYAEPVLTVPPYIKEEKK